MKKFIYKLRNRSEKERRHILHIVTFIFAIILLVLWVYSLGGEVASEEAKDEMQKDLQPFNMLKDSITNTNQ